MLAERAGEAFGPSFFAFLFIALVSGALSYHVKGEAAFFDSLRGGWDLLLTILPRISAALLVAGFIRVLLSRELIARWLGGQSGLRGILIGELAGLCTPGGPVTAFSLIAALRVAGADRGVLVAYATGWALLGLQRILVWEVPFLGADFALTRVTASVLLPICAALLARRMRFGLEPRPPATG